MKHKVIFAQAIGKSRNMSNNGNGIQHLNQGDFERVVLKSSTPTVVDFYADWCGPCRVVGPVIESLSKEYDGMVNFAKVDTDANQGLAIRYEIMSIPTVMIFKDGRIVGRIVGAVSAQVYRQRIDAVLGAN
ncbi:MAG TPA: thioredoxin [Nitrososphaerales archaeon]|nr:thioredoxin [Nitrososphaerales archaeon]